MERTGIFIWEEEINTIYKLKGSLLHVQGNTELFLYRFGKKAANQFVQFFFLIFRV